MALPLALMAAGTAMQMYGQYRANMDQAKAEFLNADMYRKQARFVLDAQFRADDLARQAYSRQIGAQTSAYAKGGVDISGSASAVIAGSYANKIEELAAIKKKGALEYELATVRGQQSQSTAELLQSPGYNMLQMGGTALTSYAMAKG